MSRSKRDQFRRRESGQVTILFAVMMSLFLLAFVGLATDYTSFWFQRQSVQGAVDATCQAAALDLLLYAQSDQTAYMHFTPGATPVSCTASPSPAPCVIAAYNGYDGTKAGTTASMSFPTTVSGVTAAPGVAWPFVKVDLTQQTTAYFSSLFTLQRKVNVHSAATCGLISALGSGGLLVLRPYPQITTYTQAAGSTVKLVGGAPVGLQVNAASVHATSFGAGAKADFSSGGPGNTGSDLAVTGTQANPGSSAYNGGTTGLWLSPDTPQLNPYLGLSTPVAGGNGVVTNNVPQNTDGCPDPNKCTEYGPGTYASITVGGAANQTAIFKPGVYYMNGDLTVTNGSTVRNAILTTGPGYHVYDGVFFYFKSGKPNITAGNPTAHGLSTMASTKLTCDGSSPPAIYSIPANLTGNVLFAQCTQDGKWYNGSGDPSGTVRGILFYQDPANTTGTAPSLTGSTNTISVYAGTEVLHNTSYTSNLIITAAANDGLITWGNIVTDILNINVTPSNSAFEIPMLLNGPGTSPVSKIAMVR